MNRVVIKRDGLEKNFDITCIEEAIKKAAIAASKEINDFDDIISKITNKLNKEKMTVEEIQEVIEHTLMVSKYKDVAKKYAGQGDAADKLATKIQKGGAGVWGSVPMPPNNVTPAEAKELATWVLAQK